MHFYFKFIKAWAFSVEDAISFFRASDQEKSSVRMDRIIFPSWCPLLSSLHSEPLISPYLRIHLEQQSSTRLQILEKRGIIKRSTSGYLLEGEKLILFSQLVFRNFTSTVQISEFIHFHPLLRSHHFRYQGHLRACTVSCFIFMLGAVPEFFKGEGGVAGSLGLRNLWDIRSGAITFVHWCHCSTMRYFYRYFIQKNMHSCNKNEVTVQCVCLYFCHNIHNLYNFFWFPKRGGQPPNPLPPIRPYMHHLFETYGFTRPSTFHCYLVRRSSQIPNHRGQQTPDELFRELNKTLYCV